MSVVRGRAAPCRTNEDQMKPSSSAKAPRGHTLGAPRHGVPQGPDGLQGSATLKAEEKDHQQKKKAKKRAKKP